MSPSLFPVLAKLVATGLMLTAGLLPAASRESRNWRLDFHSSTVVQALSDVAQEQRSLVTTYYQAEWRWQPMTWLGVQSELEGGQVLGHNQAENLGENLGSHWKLNEMQENPDLFVPILFLAGKIADLNLSWRLGKISPESCFDDNRGARSKRTKFIAQPFFRNTAVAAASKGLGGFVRWAATPRVELALCASDANARSTLSGLSTWRGEWFRSAELTLRPLAAPTRATVRLVLWETERADVEDGGWGISADWEIAPTWVAFLRAGDGSESFARSRNLFAGGISWEAPFGRRQDFFGIGLAQADAVRGGRRTESMCEVVYRWQINPRIALSPHVQYIRHPARSTVPDAWAFGFRFSIAVAK